MDQVAEGAQRPNVMMATATFAILTKVKITKQPSLQAIALTHQQVAYFTVIRYVHTHYKIRYNSLKNS